jgi:hypothetical protein
MVPFGQYRVATQQNTERNFTALEAVTLMFTKSELPSTPYMSLQRGTAYMLSTLFVVYLTTLSIAQTIQVSRKSRAIGELGYLAKYGKI